MLALGFTDGDGDQLEVAIVLVPGGSRGDGDDSAHASDGDAPGATDDARPALKRPACHAALIGAIKRPAAGKPYGLTYPPTFASTGFSMPTIDRATMDKTCCHNWKSKMYTRSKSAARSAGYAKPECREFAQKVYKIALNDWELAERSAKLLKKKPARDLS